MGKTEGESMKITVDLDEIKLLGYKRAFLLGYCRAKPNFTIKELCDDLGMCDNSARDGLNDLEAMGYLEQVYGVSERYLSKKERGCGRKHIMLGVKVYD